MNRLLRRQIQKQFGDTPLPREILEFFEVISSSYDHYEQDRTMLERSIEISSEEMIELNASQKQAHGELRTLFENIEEVFFTVKFPERKLLQMSPACQKVYGRPVEEFYKNPLLWFELIYKEDKKVIDAKYPDIFLGFAFEHEYRILHKDGTLRWVETKIKSSLDNEGNLVRIDGFTSDITKRKEAELAKAESESKYKELFEKMADGAYKSSHEGRFIEVNPALVNMLGYSSKEELIAIDIKKDLYFKSTDREEAVDKDLMEGISTFQLRKKDGTAIWVEDRGQYVADADGTIIYHEGILRDITERQKAREELLVLNNNLKLSITHLSEAQQIARLGSWILDLKTETWMRSPEFYKIFNLTSESFPTSCDDYLSFFHPDDRQKVAMYFESALKNYTPYRFEARIVLKDGMVKNIISIARPIKDESGEVTSIHGTIQDITEQKKIELELEQNNTQLKKSNSELDKFVYSVSHDLRAPLSSMLGVIDIMLEETKEELTTGHLKMLFTNIKKLDGFIEDILNYSRNSRLELKSERIDFNELLEETTQNLKFIGGNNRKVDIKVYVNEKSAFHSDKSRLTIILNNLVSNAIRYQNHNIKDPFVDIKVDTSDTETNIIVRDNGIGINKELHQKIFEMFFRVSEESVGSGLGLYLVKEMVSKLNGRIEVNSELEKGTEFKIHLPNFSPS